MKFKKLLWLATLAPFATISVVACSNTQTTASGSNSSSGSQTPAGSSGSTTATTTTPTSGSLSTASVVPASSALKTVPRHPEDISPEIKTAFQKAAGNNLRTLARMRLIVRATFAQNPGAFAQRFTALAGTDATKVAAVNKFKTDWMAAVQALMASLNDGSNNIFSDNNKYANGTATQAEYQALKTNFISKVQALLDTVKVVSTALGIGPSTGYSTDYTSYISGDLSNLVTLFQFAPAYQPSRTTRNDLERYLESIVGESAPTDPSNPNSTTPNGLLTTTLTGIQDNAQFTTTSLQLISLMADRMVRLIDGGYAAVRYNNVSMARMYDYYDAMKNFDGFQQGRSYLENRGNALFLSLDRIWPVVKQLETTLQPLFANSTSAGTMLMAQLKPVQNKTAAQKTLWNMIVNLQNLSMANQEFEKIANVVYPNKVAISYTNTILKNVKTFEDYYAKLATSWQASLNTLKDAWTAVSTIPYFAATDFSGTDYTQFATELSTIKSTVTPLNTDANIKLYQAFQAPGTEETREQDYSLQLFNQRTRAITSELQAELVSYLPGYKIDLSKYTTTTPAASTTATPAAATTTSTTTTTNTDSEYSY